MQIETDMVIPLAPEVSESEHKQVKPIMIFCTQIDPRNDFLYFQFISNLQQWPNRYICKILYMQLSIHFLLGYSNKTDKLFRRLRIINIINDTVKLPINNAII